MSILHHIHRRKRAGSFPYSSFSMRAIDSIAVAAGVIGPLMAAPQLSKIYVERSAEGLSPLSWFSWAVLNLVFIVYAIVHRDRVILITYIAWFCINFLIGVGAILYG